MNLSMVYAFFENPNMLALQYAVWAAYPDDIKSSIEVVLVDAGGGHWATHVDRPAGLPPIRIFRIDRHQRWNQDAARNIGAFEASMPWLLLSDIDHVVSLDCLQRAMRQTDTKTIYTFGRVDMPDLQPRLRNGKMHCHPNSWLMTKELYWKIGGYDERLVGYYGSDGQYRARARSYARLRALLDAQLIRYPTDLYPDASTTTLTRKGSENDLESWRLVEARRNHRITTLTHPYERLL